MGAMRYLLMLAAALVVALLAVSAPADASPYIRYGLQDDAWLAYGPGTLDERIDTLDRMGVTLVRYTLEWSRIEPRQGKYDWDQADAILRGLNDARARARRDDLGHAALGERRPLAELGAAVEVVVRRLCAQRPPSAIRSCATGSIWNEPNQRRWLRPTSPRATRRRS